MQIAVIVNDYFIVLHKWNALGLLIFVHFDKFATRQKVHKTNLERNDDYLRGSDEKFCHFLFVYIYAKLSV